jgi:hypothetical protein
MEKHKGRSNEGRRKELKGAASKGRDGDGGCVAIAMKAMADTAATWPECGKATKVTTMRVKAQKNKSAVFFLFNFKSIMYNGRLASTYFRPLSLLSYWLINLKCTKKIYFLALALQVVRMFFSLFLFLIFSI